MGREIKRVPMDFSAPLTGTWEGYVTPDKFSEIPCPDCTNGYSKYAEHLRSLWYGYVPFDPESTGSTPLRHDTPAVRAYAERNITSAPEFYGSGEDAIVREALRLAKLFNGQWCHHLTQDDVDALVEGGRLKDLTHTWSREAGWQPIEPPVTPTAAQVNEWSLSGFGHDGINASIVVNARCEREGVDSTCLTCEGHSSREAYPGQRQEAEDWQRTEPPEGEGWQLWQRVSDGPISPVFATPEELASWMASPAYTWGASRDELISYENALSFVKEGWAPTGAFSASHGVETGENWIGRTGLEIAEIVSGESE